MANGDPSTGRFDFSKAIFIPGSSGKAPSESLGGATLQHQAKQNPNTAKLIELKVINDDLQGIVDIGRSSKNHIQIKELTVSGKHLALRVKNNQLQFIARKTTNGTWVAGTERAELGNIGPEIINNQWCPLEKDLVLGGAVKLSANDQHEVTFSMYPSGQMIGIVKIFEAQGNNSSHANSDSHTGNRNSITKELHQDPNKRTNTQ